MNGNRVEMCRTTHSKTYNDLVKCTEAPKNSTFIFMDDQYHDKMRNELVEYLNIKPYTYHISFVDMINRLVKSDIGSDLIKDDKEVFKLNLLKEMKKYRFRVIKKNETELMVDKAVTKKMMLHLQKFLKGNNKLEKTNIENIAFQKKIVTKYIMSSFSFSSMKMAADGAAKAKSVSKDAMDKSKVLAQKGKVMAKQGLDGARSKADQAAVHMKRASASASKAASCMRECQRNVVKQEEDVHVDVEVLNVERHINVSITRRLIRRKDAKAVRVL